MKVEDILYPLIRAHHVGDLHGHPIVKATWSILQKALKKAVARHA